LTVVLAVAGCDAKVRQLVVELDSTVRLDRFRWLGSPTLGAGAEMWSLPHVSAATGLTNC
jgi:hypothetical protein